MWMWMVEATHEQQIYTTIIEEANAFLVVHYKGHPILAVMWKAPRIYVQKDKDYYPFTALIFWHTSCKPLKDSE